MPIAPTHDEISLKDLIDQLGHHSVQVNPRYQRSGQIWPARAKSFLVETVLLGMPIPRVLLHELDNPTPAHHSDIIDGQQRCTILAAFRSDEFALTDDVDDENTHGKRFSDLTRRQRDAFDSYPVPVDKYTGVTHKQIRQVFRRLNYYTAPLNDAEQRHAQFYGELSRFVEEQAEQWDATFNRLRVFTKRQFRRKANEQLMAELVDAMLNGISTTTAKSLRDTYKVHERQFSSIADFRRRLDGARDRIHEWTALQAGPLRKHYQVFSLVLAVMHAQGDLASIRADLGEVRALRSDDEVRRRLEPLEYAIRNRSERGRYSRFWTASHEKTNVRENRLARCRFFYAAVAGAPADR